jgi:hypothetical protein
MVVYIVLRYLFTKLRESYNILYFDYFIIIVVPDKITKQLKTSIESDNHKIIYLKSL